MVVIETAVVDVEVLAPPVVSVARVDPEVLAVSAIHWWAVPVVPVASVVTGVGAAVVSVGEADGQSALLVLTAVQRWREFFSVHRRLVTR